MTNGLIAVEGSPVALTDAQDIQVSVVRPDDSVVERNAVAVFPTTLQVDFHDDDLTLPGTYVGQVSFRVEEAVSIFGPAFTFEVSPS